VNWETRNEPTKSWGLADGQRGLQLQQVEMDALFLAVKPEEREVGEVARWGNWMLGLQIEICEQIPHG
jgi:hypothetical protein